MQTKLDVRNAKMVTIMAKAQYALEWKPGEALKTRAKTLNKIEMNVKPAAIGVMMRYGSNLSIAEEGSMLEESTLDSCVCRETGVHSESEEQYPKIP